MTQLKITTLGGLRIYLDNQPVTGFVSRKVDALLVYLAANPREHPREILGELLWDDLPQTRTMSYLRTALSSLQKQISPYLLVTRQTIGINPDSNYWIDIHEIDTKLTIMEEKWQAQRTFNRGLAEQIQTALELYQGPFLDGFYIRDARGFEGWQVLEQERLRSRVLEALFRLAQYDLDHNQYTSGLGHVSKALQLDPLWENAYRLQMRLLAYTGQRSAVITQFETWRELLDEELGIEPDEDSIELYEQILNGEITPQAIPTTPHNLPSDPTPFVNRPEEIDQISDQLDQVNCRLLTLVGQGGIGKTRLALEIARRQLENFPHGVYFINFAPLRSVDQITNTIANVFNLAFQHSGTSEQELLNYLSDRKLLLILDNFEHLLDGVDILIRLLDAAPEVKLLITTRERLNLQEEWLYPVEALTIPDNLTEVTAERSASVKLFAQTAQRLQPDFNLKNDWESVVRVCQLVEGMPLAIELAASWIRIMPVSQIVTEIQNGLDIFTTSLRNIPERHRSIRAVFESSWNQLDDREQRAFRHLAVFRGSFQQEAAQSIAETSIFMLSNLVDKSLLNSTSGNYSIHELLRQFAEEKLTQNPQEQQDIIARHSAYYAGYMHKNQSRISTSLIDSAYPEIIATIDNIWDAWDYALDQKNEKLIDQFLVGLYRIHDIQSRYHEGEELFRRAIKQMEPAISATSSLNLIHARAFLLQGLCLQSLNHYDQSIEIIETCLPVLRIHNAQWEIRSAEACLGNIAYSRSDYHSAQQHFETARTMLKDSDDLSTYVTTLMRLSDIAAVIGDYAQARKILKDTQKMMEASGSQQSRARFLITLGDLEYKLGNYDQARIQFQAALEISQELEAPTTIAVALVSLGRVAYIQQDYLKAAIFCQESINLCDKIHNLWGKAFALVHLGTVNSSIEQLTEANNCFNEALSICESIGGKWIKALALRQYAHLQVKEQKYQEALTHLEVALSITFEIRAWPLMLDIILELAEVMSQKGEKRLTQELASYTLQCTFSEYAARISAQNILDRLGLQVIPIDPAIEPEQIHAKVVSSLVLISEKFV